jgi:ADP-ribosylarginine hydrolase
MSRPAFADEWRSYLKIRGIDKPNQKPAFPDKYDVAERDAFYHKLAGKGWPGALGVDSVIIAYDALLGCNRDWRELMLRSAIHGGDSDSTACIAASWFGALYGFHGISNSNYEVHLRIA